MHYHVVLLQPPHQSVTAMSNGSETTERVEMTCRSTAASSNTFTEANTEAHAVEIDHLFVKREKGRERELERGNGSCMISCLALQKLG